MKLFDKLLNICALVTGSRKRLTDFDGWLKEKVRHSLPTYIMAVSLILWGVARTFYGIDKVNHPDHCKVNSVGDVLIAPAYALGCNIGKDRFDIRIN